MKSRAAVLPAAALVLAAGPASRSQAETLPPYVSGTVVLEITVHLITPLPVGDVVECSMTISTADNTGIPSEEPTYSDTDSYVAASGSGSVVTCSVSIPYEWTLTYADSDTMVISYGVGFADGYGPIRSATHSIPSIPMPANGTSTRLTVTTRL
jgi:hypothetical protein